MEADFMSEMTLKLKKKDINTVLGWLMVAMSVIMLLFSIACFLIYSYDTSYSDNPDSTEDAVSTSIFVDPLIFIIPISALPCLLTAFVGIQ
jgi:hypothetical protein